MLCVVPAADTRQAYNHKALWILWEAGAFTNGALNSADTDDVTAVWLNTQDNSLDIKIQFVVLCAADVISVAIIRSRCH